MLISQYCVRIICKTAGMIFFVMSCVFLIACSNDSTVDSIEVADTFLEKEIEMPSDTHSILSMESTDSGDLLMIGSSEDGSSHLLWLLRDGIAWERVFNVNEKLSLSDSKMLVTAVITKSSELLCVVTDSTNMQGELEFYLIELISDGEFRKLEIDMSEKLSSQTVGSYATYFSDLLPYKDGLFILVGTDNTLYLLDSNKETFTPLVVEEEHKTLSLISLASVAEKTIALCQDEESGDSSIYYFLDSTTSIFSEFEKVMSDKLLSLFSESESLSHFNVMMSIDSNFHSTNRATICLNNGIFELSNDTVNKIVDAEETVLSSPSLINIGCIFESEDVFFLINVNPNTNEAPFSIYKYEKSVEHIEKTTSLHIYSLEDTAEVRQAISLFKSKNPQVDVSLEIGLKGDDSTVGDALRSLSTELLAGHGPDVIFLDGLPIQDYYEMGVLCDLTDIYDEAIESGNYYENVLSSYVYNGKCWALPMRFSFPIVIAPGNSIENTDTLSALKDLAEDMLSENSGSTVFCDQEILDCIFTSLYPEIIAEEVNRDALSDFFMNIKNISIILESADERNSIYPILEDTDSHNDHTQSLMFHYGLSSYLSETNQIFITNILKEDNFGYIKTAQDNTDVDMTIKALVLGSSTCFIPSSTVAISHNSKESELSAEFIKMMLGDDYQYSSQNEGLSINSAVLEYQTSKDHAIFFSEDDYIFSEAFTVEDLSFYSTLFSSLNTPVCIDSQIKTIIYEQLQRYLSEEATLEETVEASVRRINLYLNE